MRGTLGQKVKIEEATSHQRRGRLRFTRPPHEHSPVTPRGETRGPPGKQAWTPRTAAASGMLCSLNGHHLTKQCPPVNRTGLNIFTSEADFLDQFRLRVSLSLQNVAVLRQVHYSRSRLIRLPCS